MSDLTSYSVLEGVFGPGAHNAVTSSELRAFITPEGALNKKVSWASDNPNVAFVDGDGLIVRVKAAGEAGEANITVTTKDKGKTASCKVSVDQADLFAPSDIMVGTLGVDALTGPIFRGGVYVGNN